LSTRGHLSSGHQGILPGEVHMWPLYNGCSLATALVLGLVLGVL